MHSSANARFIRTIKADQASQLKRVPLGPTPRLFYENEIPVRKKPVGPKSFKVGIIL